MTNKELKKSLRIDKEELKRVKVLRGSSIEYAKKLPKGSSQTNRALHDLWSSGQYAVGVGKPGKEDDETRSKPNPNDMWPYIRTGENVKTESATFRDVFKELEHAEGKSRWALELLGALFVRSAKMLDHKDGGNKVIYEPPRVVLDEIKKDLPSMFGVPLEVFLQYIEAIALNEDVKYETLGHLRGKPYGPGAGRTNNLLTCAHLIGVLLKRVELVDFAYGFSMMRGVSPINMKTALVVFPMLGDSEGVIEKEV